MAGSGPPDLDKEVDRGDPDKDESPDYWRGYFVGCKAQVTSLKAHVTRFMSGEKEKMPQCIMPTEAAGSAFNARMTDMRAGSAAQVAPAPAIPAADEITTLLDGYDVRTGGRTGVKDLLARIRVASDAKNTELISLTAQVANLKRINAKGFAQVATFAADHKRHGQRLIVKLWKEVKSQDDKLAKITALASLPCEPWTSSSPPTLSDAQKK